MTSLIPTIGRIVHLRLAQGETSNGKEVVPAIVTAVHQPGRTDSSVNLQVFYDMAPVNFMTDVRRGDERTVRSWFWPPR